MVEKEEGERPRLAKLMNTGRYECDMSCRLGKYGFERRGRKKKFWICSTEGGNESVIRGETQVETRRRTDQMEQETERSKGQHRAAHRQRILQLMEMVIVKESKRERDGREG